MKLAKICEEKQFPRFLQWMLYCVDSRSVFVDGGSWQRGNKTLCGQPKCGHRSISSKVWLPEATSHQVINYCSNWYNETFITVQFTLVPNTMAFVFVLLTTQRQHAVLMVLKIHFRITEMWDYAKFGCPMKHAGKYYFFHNTGLQNQRYMYLRICDLLLFLLLSFLTFILFLRSGVHVSLIFR